jgi:hypothetical protein
VPLDGKIGSNSGAPSPPRALASRAHEQAVQPSAKERTMSRAGSERVRERVQAVQE